jgi:hypothetical protein
MVNMVSTAKELEKSIDEVMKSCGYIKKGRNWYRSTEETMRVVNLQRSQWGAQLYINLGLSITAIQDKPFPKEYECHVRIRLTEIVPEETQLERSLDLEDPSIGPDQRSVSVQHCLREYGVPLLDSINHLDALRSWVDSGDSNGALVTLSARDYLQKYGV